MNPYDFYEEFFNDEMEFFRDEDTSAEEEYYYFIEYLINQDSIGMPEDDVKDIDSSHEASSQE